MNLPLISSNLNRRSFIHTSASAIGSAAAVCSMQSFLNQQAYGAAVSRTTHLAPIRDETTDRELLQLPEGFRYRSFSWTGDELAAGGRCPAGHDGMGVVAQQDNVVTLIRNHEVSRDEPAFGDPSLAWDPRGGGGCTRLKFDLSTGEWLSCNIAISGTHRNCAGGVTPWGSWLTCEETVEGPGDHRDGRRLSFQRTHGWIFEVHADGQEKPVALKDMGRFVHEAVAVDPKTGYVYETEDRLTSGFYRFVPDTPGHLADGGRLQMMKAKGVSDLRTRSNVRQKYDISWVDIDEPQRSHDNDSEDGQTLGVFRQGQRQGGATFARLEGCWYGNDRIYVVSTSGGCNGSGQIWACTPAEQTMELIFESPSNDVLDSPDNIAVHNSGALVLCEDGSVVPQRIHWLGQNGQLTTLATNNVVLTNESGNDRDFRGAEWAGATFSADGSWLFVNIQSPGITFAITGPWDIL